MPAEEPKSMPLEKRKDADSDRNWFGLELARLQHRCWYGTVTVKIEHGQFRHIEVSSRGPDGQPVTQVIPLPRAQGPRATPERPRGPQAAPAP